MIGSKLAPMQERSLERVSMILDSARQLFAAHDIVDVNMLQIAAMAQSTPSSVYRYFPNKNAIVAELYRQQCAAQNEVVLSILRSLTSLDDLPDAGVEIVLANARLISEQPAARSIADAVASSTMLRHLKYANNDTLARLGTEVLMGFAPDADCRDEVQKHLRTVIAVYGGALREVVDADAQRVQGLLDSFCTMTRVHLQLIVATMRVTS